MRCRPRTWGWCIILWLAVQNDHPREFLTYRWLFQTQNSSHSGATEAGWRRRKKRKKMNRQFHLRLAALDQFLYTITAAVYWGSICKLFYIKCLLTLAFAAERNYWHLSTNTLTILLSGHPYVYMGYAIPRAHKSMRKFINMYMNWCKSHINARWAPFYYFCIIDIEVKIFCESSWACMASASLQPQLFYNTDCTSHSW